VKNFQCELNANTTLTIHPLVNVGPFREPVSVNDRSSSIKAMTNGNANTHLAIHPFVSNGAFSEFASVNDSSSSTHAQSSQLA